MIPYAKVAGTILFSGTYQQNEEMSQVRLQQILLEKHIGENNSHRAYL